MTKIEKYNIESENTPIKNSITDSRGFIIYSEITDYFGAKITVKESSNASGPLVWIFSKGGEGEYGDNNDGAAHLNAEQARAVRDALTKFIDDIPTRWDLSEEE